MRKNPILFLILILGITSLVFAQADKGDSNKSNYAFSKEVNLSYEQALEKVTQELKKEGFGIITEIDVKATMKKKSGVDYRPYKILGACNPKFAHKALEAEEQIGLMLPCNVIVYENNSGKTVVSAVDPVSAMGAVENSELEEIAKSIQAKLKKVIDQI